MNYGYGPSNSISSFMSDDFYLPQDQDQIVELIQKREAITAVLLNIREIGQYETIEVITGQTWFTATGDRSTYGQSQASRYTYRRAFDLVALFGGKIPIGATTIRVAPEIKAITTPTRGFGTATIAGPTYLFFPSADITFTFNNTDPKKQSITINNGSGSVLQQCYVVMEYLR